MKYRIANDKQVNGSAQFGSSSGAVIVETLLSLPILALFAFAIIDLSRWLYIQQTLSTIAYEVARVASADPGLSYQTAPVADNASAIALGYGDVFVKANRIIANTGRTDIAVTLYRTKDPVIFTNNRTAPSNSVIVETRAVYNSITGKIDGMRAMPLSLNVKARAIAPYLYPK